MRMLFELSDCPKLRYYSIYSLIIKQEERLIMDPSIQILPLLHLESIQNTSQSTLPHSFKLKISSKFSLTNMLDDRLPFDETTRRCSTDRSNISSSQLRELRMMKVGSLSQMSEEECIRRYAEDPFFRKKLQAELKSLKKTCLITALPKSKDFMPFEVQPTTKLIDYEDKITFRKMKLNETFEQLEEKGKFQRTLSRMDLGLKENRKF